MSRHEKLLNIARARRAEVEQELAELDAEIASRESAHVDWGVAPSPASIPELVSPCAFDHRTIDVEKGPSATSLILADPQGYWESSWEGVR